MVEAGMVEAGMIEVGCSEPFARCQVGDNAIARCAEAGAGRGPDRQQQAGRSAGKCQTCLPPGLAPTSCRALGSLARGVSFLSPAYFVDGLFCRGLFCPRLLGRWPIDGLLMAC